MFGGHQVVGEKHVAGASAREHLRLGKGGALVLDDPHADLHPGDIDHLVGLAMGSKPLRCPGHGFHALDVVADDRFEHYETGRENLVRIGDCVALFHRSSSWSGGHGLRAVRSASRPLDRSDGMPRFRPSPCVRASGLRRNRFECRACTSGGSGNPSAAPRGWAGRRPVWAIGWADSDPESAKKQPDRGCRDDSAIPVLVLKVRFRRCVRGT